MPLAFLFGSLLKERESATWRARLRLNSRFTEP